MSLRIPASRSAPGSDTTGGADFDWTGSASQVEDSERLAALYDLQFDAREEDVDWARRLAARTGGPILELACGSGRIAVPLASDGRRVVGLDASAAMLARARDRAARAGVDARFVEGDMRDFSLDETFALILIPFSSFLHLAPGDRFACLARVREHLSAQGRFAFDVFQPDPEKIAARDGGLIEEASFDDPETGERITRFSSGVATVDRTTFTWRFDCIGADHVVRRYERVVTLHFLYRRELELMLEAAGFALEELHGDYDGSPADERSPRLLAVARRRERGEARERRR
jgi:SAM-dependent methyltransferase